MIPLPSQSLQMVMQGVSRERPVVLHVDSDAASLQMVEGALASAGFDVLHAVDGIQAIDMYRAHEPDLIIMDATMPVMSGLDAMSGIRKLPGGVYVPILMTAGTEDLDSIARAYDEGAIDFLTKPLDFHTLPHRVQYLLRSKWTADALRVNQTKLDNAQRIARLGNWECRLQDQSMSWSQEFGRVLGLSDEQTIDNWNEFMDRIVDADRHGVRRLAEQAVEEKHAFNIEFTIRFQHDGSTRRIRLEAEPYCTESGDCTHMLGTIQDITERSNAQKQMHNLAYFDLITGLPNRAQLNEQLRYTLKLAKRNQGKFALLFLDLDHFKQVNDTLGHDAGDELLKQVSSRLTAVVRGGDMVSATAEELDTDDSESRHTVARIGGDEFVVLLSQVNRAEDAARVAERIAQSISLPYDIAAQNVSVTTTIGISVYPADGVTAEVLMKNADVAMYHAKESGRNGYQFYSREIHEQTLARFTLEGELKSAIENEQLTLVYQPKVNIDDGSVSGVEALVRWDHEEHGTVSPNEFILLAEETGLILPLGRWVMREATRQMQEWIEAGLEPMVIAVNCSSVQFTRSDMIEDINTAISYSGLDPQLLEIELTEKLLLQDTELGIRILRDMKALGIQVAIDDFGTGYSSLSSLKRLPVDKLKIDSSFVKELSVDAGDVAIVSAIITLSHNLNLTVVAEGVETRQQYDILHGFKCNEAQGYLISRPMKADEMQQWLINASAVSPRKVSGL